MRHFWVLAFQNLHRECRQRHAVDREGVPQRYEFVEEHAQRPDVCLFRVLGVGEDLGRQVVRRADEGLAEQASLRYTKIADYNVVAACEEDVLALEVSVENVLRVDVVQAAEQLRDPATVDVSVEQPAVSRSDLCFEVAVWVNAGDLRRTA